MLEVLALGALVLAAAMVIGLLFSLVSFVLWVLVLPFKLLGLVFKGIGVLLALPFMLLFGVLGLIVFGVGFAIFLAPAVPLVLVVWLVWWWMRRSDRTRVAA